MTHFKDPQICACFNEQCQYPEKGLSKFGLEAARGAVLTEASLDWRKFHFLINALIRQDNLLLMSEDMLTCHIRNPAQV